MRPDRCEEAGVPVPLALAAVSVDGRCRERSPADLALFGPGAERFAGRFARGGLGEALLARCTTEGSAEATAWLATVSGEARFRVSLWRQRGGERIRILAAFARIETAAPEPPIAPPPPLLPDREGLTLMGAAFRASVATLLETAETLRRAGPEAGAGRSADIVATGWRLTRLVEDLDRLAIDGPGLPRPRPGETDLAALIRRLVRLAAPLAEAGGVTVRVTGLPPRGAGPLVLADEGQIWTGLEALIRGGIASAGRNGRLALDLSDERQGGGLALSVLAEGADGRLPPPPTAVLDLVGPLLSLNGITIAPMVPEGQGFHLQLTLPPDRCLDPA